MANNDMPTPDEGSSDGTIARPEDELLRDVPEADEPEEVTVEPGADLDEDGYGEDGYPEPPRPVNWRTLTAEDAEHEWLALNEWVNWLRTEFGLPAAIIPPYWHRNPELVWELSALHLRWLGAYDPQQDAAGPLAFMTDFHNAQQRLREWVTISGTRLDRDRPTRQTTWPGEDAAPETSETPITDRDADFVQHVLDDTARRAEAEAAFLRGEIADL
ncbi:hypothetical protein N8K70_08105 [Microbacterium betulae]|uniref:DUF4913 domain-containing protein n=1 Tax=Microbacterium betulae TaxID=2981139 RepID=A0AA97I8F6_9MICO|nr:hypothetical protein [Microbacterium sp. AB]WOF24602.1 hypothetical protein N8K70_08105 [Microbacterium sp. AB]